MASIPTGDGTFSMSFTNNLKNPVDIPVPVWKTDLAMTQVMTISPVPDPNHHQTTWHTGTGLARKQLDRDWILLGLCDHQGPPIAT